MTGVSLSLGLTSRASSIETMKFASYTERSSVDGIWIGEDISSRRDVFVQAFTATEHAPTKHVSIGVTSPLIRNITTIARAAVTLSETSSGKFRLGLGVGGLRDLERLGISVARPVQRLGSTVEGLHKIWTGEVLSLKREGIELRQYVSRHISEANIPIYFGVRGPFLLRLAGEIADGVILSGPAGYMKKAVRIVQNPEARRTSAPPRVVTWLPTLLTRRRADIKLARTVTATVVADTPDSVLEMSGVGDDAKRVQEVARSRGYAAASSLVTDELLNHFTISGSAEDICGVFQSLAKIGVQEVVFGPPYGRRPLAAVREVVEIWGRL